MNREVHVDACGLRVITDTEETDTGNENDARGGIEHGVGATRRVRGEIRFIGLPVGRDRRVDLLPNGRIISRQVHPNHACPRLGSDHVIGRQGSCGHPAIEAVRVDLGEDVFVYPMFENPSAPSFAHLLGERTAQQGCHPPSRRPRLGDIIRRAAWLALWRMRSQVGLCLGDQRNMALVGFAGRLPPCEEPMLHQHHGTRIGKTGEGGQRGTTEVKPWLDVVHQDDVRT